MRAACLLGVLSVVASGCGAEALERPDGAAFEGTWVVDAEHTLREHPPEIRHLAKPPIEGVFKRARLIVGADGRVAWKGLAGHKFPPAGPSAFPAIEFEGWHIVTSPGPLLRMWPVAPAMPSAEMQLLWGVTDETMWLHLDAARGGDEAFVSFWGWLKGRVIYLRREAG
jgi:hypothetical protein